MKLPYIRKATWENKRFYPFAKYVVVERKYNTYYACASLCEAISCWFRLLGESLKIAFGIKKK